MFNSISTFRQSLEHLYKKESDGYGSCKADICSTLKDHSFEDIWEMGTIIRQIGDVRIIKIRIQNSLQNLSTADGYRIIICCKSKTRQITLLNVYPKRGKLGRIDQTRDEYKQQVKTYSKESNSSKKHDIQNNLEIIEAEAGEIKAKG